jgi:hypothetical protein
MTSREDIFNIKRQEDDDDLESSMLLLLPPNPDVMTSRDHNLCRQHQQENSHHCISRRRASPATAMSVIFSLFVIIVSFLVLELLAPSMIVIPFASATQTEKRVNSRIVTTKYGALKGYLLNLPNRSLQTVNVFMGEFLASSTYHVTRRP